jgi:hypothetical protein
MHHLARGSLIVSKLNSSSKFRFQVSSFDLENTLIPCRYCKFIGKPQTFDTVTLGDMSSFLRWMMNQRRGHGGRRLCGTKLSTSLEIYWKQFRLVYERATGRKIDGQTTRQMHTVSAILFFFSLQLYAFTTQNLDADSFRSLDRSQRNPG